MIVRTLWKCKQYIEDWHILINNTFVPSQCIIGFQKCQLGKVWNPFVIDTKEGIENVDEYQVDSH